MPNQLVLPGLTPREAIADALHRSVVGIDSNNREILESGLLKNEEIVVIAGPVTVQGWPAVSEFFDTVFKLTTTHVTSNIRIEVEDGADTASMTAHAISYHVKPEDALKEEDTSYTAACLYDIDLVKDGNDGLWKIKKWILKILWTTGDKAVLYG
ncbi:hypothetical protein V491_09301 [Pseudogymnoascus sp. VKM F-3775]|nr:hypothetical protein V491_09301 [Pseudogymnoascus sp. VKM F-3775]